MKKSIPMNISSDRDPKELEKRSHSIYPNTEVAYDFIRVTVGK